MLGLKGSPSGHPDPTLGRFAGQFVAAQILGGRQCQEDDFAILHFREHGVEQLIMAIADGMGGHDGAAEVARIAVKSFCDAMKRRTGLLAARLRPSLEYANAEIALAGARDPKINGAGCTFVGAAIENDTMSWISVGDSSLYLFRNRILRKLNEMPPAFTRATPSSAGRVLPGLTGAELHFVTMASEPLRISAHDGILVASDGLDCLGVLKIERILLRTAKLNPERVVERLLSSVQSLPLLAQDNTTVIFCRVPASKEVARSRLLPSGRSAHWKLVVAAAAAIGVLVAAVERLLR